MSKTKQRPELPRKFNLGCGDDIRDGWHNVDLYDRPGVDETADLNSTPWPTETDRWPSDHCEYILLSHVLEHLDDIEATLRECARLLTETGRLEVRLPIGENAHADSDHTWGENHQRWSYKTPEFLCGERYWDVDVGLEVVEKDVILHSHYNSYLLRGLQWVKWGIENRTHGAGAWAFNQPASSGEFVVIFGYDC